MSITGDALGKAMQRVARALVEEKDCLNTLDQRVGDGDLGITAEKIGTALDAYVMTSAPGDDLGQYLIALGMELGGAAPSTMGNLLGTALMRAGKEIRGQGEIESSDLPRMLAAAYGGIQDRGKAELGDKTILDALHPAIAAFSEAIASGDGLEKAAMMMQRGAEEGMRRTKELQSRKGRAMWVGERTVGEIDPGSYLLVVVVTALRGRGAP